MKKGFTLMELLVAGSIFSIISLVAMTIFINVVRTNRRINLENHIYTESHILMEKIVREIRQGTIDYEEYQSRQVLLAADYGENYGEYAKKFYHPGYKDNANNIDTDGNGVGFGLVCADEPGTRYDPKCTATDTTCLSTCSPYLPSQDFNTGKNPYEGSSTTSDDATALCDNTFNEPLTNVDASPNRNCNVKLDEDGDITTEDGTNPSEPADFEALHFQKELYLINSNGDQKTILTREVRSTGKDSSLGTSDDEYALSIVRLNGEDKDQDDIRETWTCTEEFNCTKNTGEKPEPLDLTDLLSHACVTPSCPPEIISGENFIPLTPSSINVTSVKFLIAPLEDPHKAYAEDDATGDYILMQPYITIVLTIKPAYKEAYKLYGTYDLFPEITLQTTVSSRVYSEVKSF